MKANVTTHQRRLLTTELSLLVLQVKSVYRSRAHIPDQALREAREEVARAGASIRELLEIVEQNAAPEADKNQG